MNENDHGTEEHGEIYDGENYVNPCVLEVRRIREEIRREFNNDSRAYLDYLNRNAGKVTGNVLNIPPPPPAFPPSQEWLDFVAIYDKQEEEEQRRFDAAAARRARASARRARTSTGGRRTKATTGAVAAVHAGV
jgi:hypothetical protein